MASILDKQCALYKLKLAMYVDRILTAAETALAAQPWWNKDIEALHSLVRLASIDQIASVFSTWEGQKWLDKSEGLAARQWLSGGYPKHGSKSMYQISELVLNYCPTVNKGDLALRLRNAGSVLIRGNTHLLRFPPQSPDAVIYWESSHQGESLSFRDQEGREIHPTTLAVPLIHTIDASDSPGIPILDETSGVVQPANPDLCGRVGARIARMPASLLDLVTEGKGAIVVSETVVAIDDTRPLMSISPADLDGVDCGIERQLLMWLGAEYVRMEWPTQMPEDLWRMAIQQAWHQLGSPDVRPKSIRSTTRIGSDLISMPSLNRSILYDALQRSLSGITEVVHLLPLSERARCMLEPIVQNAVVKTSDNEVVQANWYLVDRVATLTPETREHIVNVLSKDNSSECELFIIAACKYAEGEFSDALRYARLCSQLDGTCMEYRFLAAFCLRHLGQVELFEAEVFPVMVGAS